MTLHAILAVAVQCSICRYALQQSFDFRGQKLDNVPEAPKHRSMKVLVTQISVSVLLALASVFGVSTIKATQQREVDPEPPTDSL